MFPEGLHASIVISLKCATAAYLSDLCVSLVLIPTKYAHPLSILTIHLIFITTLQSFNVYKFAMSEISASTLAFTRPEFNPTPADAIIARHLLHGLRIRQRLLSINLPWELALHIADLADYNPRIASRRVASASFPAKYHGPENPWSDEANHAVAGPYLVSPPLPIPPSPSPETSPETETETRGFKPRIRAKWVAFQIKSADQGWATWGGEGTYENSHTWFEVSILRPRQVSGDVSNVGNVAHGAGHVGDMRIDLRVRDRASIADYKETMNDLGWDFVKNGNSEEVGWLVHHNLTACREYKDYRVEWDLGATKKVDKGPPSVGDGVGFVAALRAGDPVVLWARAEVSTFLTWDFAMPVGRCVD